MCFLSLEVFSDFPLPLVKINLKLSTWPVRPCDLAPSLSQASSQATHFLISTFHPYWPSLTPHPCSFSLQCLVHLSLLPRVFYLLLFHLANSQPCSSQGALPQDDFPNPCKSPVVKAQIFLQFCIMVPTILAISFLISTCSTKL